MCDWMRNKNMIYSIVTFQQFMWKKLNENISPINVVISVT